MKPECLKAFRTLYRYAACLAVLWSALAVASAQDQTNQVQVVFSEHLGPLNLDHMGVGQGGLSPEPMWAERVPEIRALHPRMIRLFVQEYFDLLPKPGHYHFDTLDQSVNTILQTGAKPLMCLCFKPHVLFPEVNQDIVEPNNYAAWDELIFQLVKHYQKQHAGIVYWEIGNEPDIGESGGCPYRFKADSYVRYYQHTVSAILRADPNARVGGPAVSSCRARILSALLEFCQTNGTPLDFVSWHNYSSDPKGIRSTITYVQGRLKQFPALKPETILDEWNMDLFNPPLDPRFQPCYAAEVIWQMKDAGLDYSCYYHIRDWYVNIDQFTPFMSEQGSAFMARWWDRMPQFDGLFDYQNQVRPSYFVFKLLGRLAGDRVPVISGDPAVHGFAAHDPQMRMDNLVLWNFSAKPAQIELSLVGLPKATRTRHLVLDATTGSSDENARLSPEPFTNLRTGDTNLFLRLEPYAVHYWSFE